MKVIGIVGSRRRDGWDDYNKCERKVLEIFKEGDRIVSGGCPVGGDFFAERIARNLGCTITIHHANWTRNGKKAGFIRNEKIARDCGILVALVADDRKGGTEDTIARVLELGKEVILI